MFKLTKISTSILKKHDTFLKSKVEERIKLSSKNKEVVDEKGNANSEQNKPQSENTKTVRITLTEKVKKALESKFPDIKPGIALNIMGLKSLLANGDITKQDFDKAYKQS